MKERSMKSVALLVLSCSLVGMLLVGSAQAGDSSYGCPSGHKVSGVGGCECTPEDPEARGFACKNYCRLDQHCSYGSF